MSAKLLTYADWAVALEKFGNGDDTVIEQIVQSQFVADAGTALRFFDRAQKAYQARKNKWLDAFNRAGNLDSIKRDEEFGILIRNANVNMQPLCRFTQATGLPESLTDFLKKDLLNFINDVRSSLKENLKKAGTNKDSFLVHLNRLGAVLENNHSASQIKQQPDSVPGPRRILF